MSAQAKIKTAQGLNMIKYMSIIYQNFYYYFFVTATKNKYIDK